MGRPRWRNAWWQCRVGSLIHSVAYLPLGVMFLQLIGCALGSGSSPALKKDTRSLQMRPKASVERKVKGPEQPDVRSQVEQPRAEKAFGIVTDRPPRSKEQRSPSEGSLLPPLPAKPPPMGGSGG